MSLYYVLLRGWVVPFGTSEVAMRLPSALFGVGTVAAVYALGRRLLGGLAALAAAFLLALNNFHLWHAHDARSYSMVELLVTLAALTLVLLVNRPNWLRVLAYAAVAGASLYAHFFAALALAGQLLGLTFRGLRRLPWKHLAVALAAVGLAALPLAAFVVVRDVGQVDWIPPVEPRRLRNLAIEISGGSRLLAVGYAVLGLVALATAVPLRRRAGRPLRGNGDGWAIAFLLAWLLMPPAVGYAISLVKPLFIERYFIVSLPALALLAGAGAARLPRPWGSAAALIVMAVLATRPSIAWHEGGLREDWRAAARQVMSSARPGDALIVFKGGGRHAFDYYRARFGSLEGPPETVYPRWEAWSDAPRPGVLEALPGRFERVWLVVRGAGQPPHRETLQSIRATLEQSYDLQSAHKLTNVDLMLYASAGRRDGSAGVMLEGDEAVGSASSIRE